MYKCDVLEDGEAGC